MIRVSVYGEGMYEKIPFIKYLASKTPKTLRIYTLSVHGFVREEDTYTEYVVCVSVDSILSVFAIFGHKHIVQ